MDLVLFPLFGGIVIVIFLFNVSEGHFVKDRPWRDT